MANLSELRTKYPQYNDMSDQEFSDKFHNKYYSDIPKEEFYSKIGFSPSEKTEEPTSVFEDLAIKSAQVIPELISGAMSLPGEVYGAATHPLRAVGNSLIGPLEGIAGAFNLPGNITRYAERKGLIPGWLQPFTKYAPYLHIPIQDIERKLGVLPSTPGDSLVRTLTGFGMLKKLSQLGEVGESANLGRAALGGAYAAGQEQNPLTGAVLASIPGMIQKGRQAYNYLREPGKALKESQEILQSIQHLLKEQQEGSEAGKTDISHFINQIQEGLSNKKNSLESKLPELFPIKPKSETRLNLSQSTSNSVKNLEQDFDKRYGEFDKDYGHLPINEPFQWNHINLDNLPHVSMTTKKMGYDVSNDQLEYTNSEGEPVKINFPADKSSVDDYVSFYRELRDAAWDMKKSAKNATFGEAKSLRESSNKLLQLQSQAAERIRSTVGEQPFENFQNIQSDYAQLMGPIKTEPSLFNAAYKKKINSTLHDTLLQPINTSIRNYLYQDSAFVNALREHLTQGPNHPLKQKSPFNPASIDEDIQYLLTPAQKAAQAERLQLHHAQKQLNDISANIKTPETLTAQQEQQARKLHPKISEYLSNEAQNRAIKKQLEQQKTEHTINKEELQRKLFKRNALLGLGASGLALSQGKNIAKFIKQLF